MALRKAKKYKSFSWKYLLDPGRAVIDTPHIDVPTIAVNRCLQSCHLDALIDASRWQKKRKTNILTAAKLRRVLRPLIVPHVWEPPCCLQKEHSGDLHHFPFAVQ